MTAFVVVNPSSANRRTGRDWPKIRDGLQDIFPMMSVAQSQARGETTQLVRAALRDGHLDIIVVGGGGTLNEAVNGFFEHGVAVSPDAVLGFVTTSTEANFARNFGIAPGYEAAMARLKKSHVRRVDIGRVSCLSLRGEPISRHFINVASFGLSGRIARLANRSGFTGLFGGRLISAIQAVGALPGWHTPRLRLIADRGYDEIAGITMVAVANGCWFGAGLKIAPDALPGDGKFDIVVVGGVPRRKALRRLAAFREGTHVSDPAVRVVRATRLTAAPTLETDGPVEIETDGESAGMLPATFEILPSAINLRC